MYITQRLLFDYRYTHILCRFMRQYTKAYGSKKLFGKQFTAVRLP